MIRLSASLIKDILVCPSRGFFRINYPEQSISTPEMKLGEIVHYAIEKFWDSEERALENIYNSALSIDADPDYAAKLVSNYFKNFKFMCSREDEAEKFFEIPMSKDVVLVGKLDRVNQKEGIVLDWKTTKSPPSSIDDDIQFMIYYYAFTRLYNKEPDLVAYMSLTKGSIIKYNKLDFYYKELFDSVLPSVIKTIKAKNFFRKGVFDYKIDKYGGKSFACNFCAFQQFCLGSNTEE